MSLGSQPKVSICIPTYNQAEFLPQAIESALAQTLTDIEVIVSVNHCTDRTEDVLKKYFDKRLHIVKPKKFLAMSENWHFCITKSRGCYINVLSSDDVLLPGFALEQAALLDHHPTAVFAHCACALINDKGCIIGKEKSIHPSFERRGDKELKRYIYGPRCVFVSALIRRTAYDKVGGFRSWKMVGDWDLWLRLLQIGDVIYNQHLLAQYRHWLDDVGARSHDQRLLVHAKEVLALYQEHEPVILEKYPDLEKDFIKAKEKKASSFVYALAAVRDPVLRQQVKDVMLELSRGPRIRLMMNSLSLGLGPVLLLLKSLKLNLQQCVKAILYPND